MKVLFIAFLAFAILLSGCTGSGPNYSEKECEDKITGEEKGNCYAGFAVRKADLGYCDQIEYTSIKEKCVYDTKQEMAFACIRQASLTPQECAKCCQDTFPADKQSSDSCSINCAFN